MWIKFLLVFAELTFKNIKCDVSINAFGYLRGIIAMLINFIIIPSKYQKIPADNFLENTEII